MARADLDRGSRIGVAARAGLALIAVAGVFVLVSLPTLARVESGFVVYIGLADLFTFVVFVLPIVCLIPVKVQLRFWYLLLLGSVVFMCGVVGYLWQETPWGLLKEPHAAWILYTGLVIAIGSCGAHLYLLRSTLARVAAKSV